MIRIDEKALAAAWAAFSSAFESHLNFPTENETVGEARLHCMRVAIRAYLSALEPTRSAMAKVKALEWVDDHPKIPRESEALAPFCAYVVCDSPGYYPGQPHIRWTLHTLPNLRGIDTSGTANRFPSMEAAKAAAQSDYERRILSALEPAPAEAEGWRPIKSAPRDETIIVCQEATEANPTYFGKPGVVVPMYIDENAVLLDISTFKPDVGISAGAWHVRLWMPLPPAPAGKE